MRTRAHILSSREHAIGSMDSERFVFVSVKHTCACSTRKGAERCNWQSRWARSGTAARKLPSGTAKTWRSRAFRWGGGEFLVSRKRATSVCNGVCLCTGNVWHGDGEKLYDSVRKLGDKIFFVHIRDVKTGMGGKEFWLDEGDIDIARVLQVPKEIGYDGFLRSEHLPTDLYGRHVPTLSGVSDVGSAWSTGYLRALV
jgi:sugar phosphate isomerase/epimerase